MPVCFTSDLHGDPGLYDQLGALLRKIQPEVLILGGDLLADGDPADPVASQCRAVEDFFFPRVTEWRRACPDLTVAALPGNHDWSATATVLAARPELVHVLSVSRPWLTGGVPLLGFHLTPWTPHLVKDFERRDCAADELPAEGGVVFVDGTVREVTAAEHYGGLPALEDELAAAPELTGTWIFVSHAPPHDTQLDRLPTLDHPIGSRAVRAFIEQRRPTLALHGHVHESWEVTGRYAERIGETVCVNPGQSRERLHAVLFDLNDPGGTLCHTVLD